MIYVYIVSSKHEGGGRIRDSYANPIRRWGNLNNFREFSQPNRRRISKLNLSVSFTNSLQCNYELKIYNNYVQFLVEDETKLKMKLC